MIIEGEKALDEIGILDGINEVIVTTERDGRKNAAPIGIIRNGDSLIVRLFSGTHTYDNILENKSFVANITHDAWIFAEAALVDLPDEHFEEHEGLLTLKGAEAWALFECNPFQSDIIMAKVKIVKGEVLRKDFRAVNRGANLVVESAIAATRYLALRTDCYYDEILKYRRIVDRCGSSREKEAMTRLVDRIDSLIHI